ncbi:MAG: MFS transporter [Verrucomicrobia bacterium]|nr:MFS transporter [Verrucomicrobiota bacterium]
MPLVPSHLPKGRLPKRVQFAGANASQLREPVFKRLPYPFLVAAVTFVTLVAAAGVLSVPTMYVRPFESEFGWSAGQVSMAQALQIALFGLTGPFAAAAMERYGVRKTIACALGVLAIASLSVTRVTALWQLLPWAAVVGVGAGTIALTLGATIANRWFLAQRGTVLGLFTAGNATGQLVFLPMFGALIEHQGWRPCAYILAALTFSFIPFFWLAMRERPVDAGIPPWGGTAIEPAPTHTRNPLAEAFRTLRQASRSRTFWLLAGSFFICGASTNGLIGAHLVPACGDRGIPETRAAGLLALMGLFDLIGTTMSGWLSDRCDSRWLLFWYYGLRGLSLLFLPFAFGSGMLGLPVFAVFYGLDWIATVPPTVRLATLAFGRERAPVVFGWIATAHQLGAACTALAAGWSRTALGTYDDAFLTSGLLCLVGSTLVLSIARRPPLEPAFATALAT